MFPLGLESIFLLRFHLNLRIKDKIIAKIGLVFLLDKFGHRLATFVVRGSLIEMTLITAMQIFPAMRTFFSASRLLLEGNVFMAKHTTRHSKTLSHPQQICNFAPTGSIETKGQKLRPEGLILNVP